MAWLLIPGLRDPLPADQAFSLGTGRLLDLSVELTSATGSRVISRAVVTSDSVIIHNPPGGWEEHSGESVRRLQVINEGALESLAAG